MVQVINVLATDFARKVADVELKATSKSELEGDIQPIGMMPGFSIGYGSFAYTEAGDLALRTAEDGWSWVGEEEEPVSTLSLQKSAVQLGNPLQQSTPVNFAVEEPVDKGSESWVNAEPTEEELEKGAEEITEAQEDDMR